MCHSCDNTFSRLSNLTRHKKICVDLKQEQIETEIEKGNEIKDIQLQILEDKIKTLQKEVKEKEKLYNSIEDDKIVTITIEDDDFLITKTTVEEQNNKSYFN